MRAPALARHARVRPDLTSPALNDMTAEGCGDQLNASTTSQRLCFGIANAYLLWMDGGSAVSKQSYYLVAAACLVVVVGFAWFAANAYGAQKEADRVAAANAKIRSQMQMSFCLKRVEIHDQRGLTDEPDDVRLCRQYIALRPN